MPELPSSISIVYESSPDRPVLPATGAIGGPSPEGSAVIAHLYAEYGSIPDSEKHAVGANSVVDLTKGEITPKNQITRKIIGTLVLAPDTATLLGNWLLDQSGKAQAVREAQQQARGAQARARSEQK